MSLSHCNIKLAVVELLLRHGAEVDKANLKNTTALMRACQEGHEVRVLLLRGNVEDKETTSLLLTFLNA